MEKKGKPFTDQTAKPSDEKNKTKKKTLIHSKKGKPFTNQTGRGFTRKALRVETQQPGRRSGQQAKTSDDGMSCLKIRHTLLNFKFPEKGLKK